jgi:chitin synthase
MTGNHNTIREYFPTRYPGSLAPYCNEKETFKGFLQKDLEQGIISNTWVDRDCNNPDSGDTSVLTCLTVYNEDGVEFVRSMAGLARNIQYCQSSATYGARKEFTLCIIADGRDRIHPTTRHWAIKLGLFNRTISPQKADDLPGGDRLSIYETILSTAKVARIAAEVAQEQNLSLMELLRQQDLQREKRYSDSDSSQENCTFRAIFCIKEENAGKLDSHWWFYNRLCPMLQPDYCIQMDVGTVPGDKTVQRLCQTLDFDDRCGAATAGILTAPPKHLLKTIDSWQYATFVWDKTTDWPVQALCGYLDVLAGQFSMIRWAALSMDVPLEQQIGQSPLKQYFRGLEKLAPVESNLFLAEDRVLGFEMIAQPKVNWIIRYVPDAIAITDECKSLNELLRQRRRWINSGNIATLYHAARYWLNRNRQTPLKLSTVGAMAWGILMTLTVWFLPFLIFTPLLVLGIQSNDIFAGNPVLIETIPKAAIAFIVLWVIQLLLCFKNKLPQNWIDTVLHTTVLLQISILLGLQFVWIVQNPPLGILFLAITMGVLLTFPLITARKISPKLFKRVIPSMLAYILGGYVLNLLLTTYSVVNLYDCSWGTKGLHLNQQAAVKQKENLQLRPKTLIFIFLLCIGALMLSLAALSGKILMSNALVGLGFALISVVALSYIKPLFSHSRHDRFMSFRNSTLIAWLMTNGGLMLAITQLEGSQLLQVGIAINLVNLAKIAFSGICGLIHYQREKRLSPSIEWKYGNKFNDMESIPLKSSPAIEIAATGTKPAEAG